MHGDTHNLPVQGNSYLEWCNQFSSLTEVKINKMRDAVVAFHARPTVSILMPVYNPPPEFLDEAILSVRNQIYPYWELCIADDASSDERVKEILNKHSSEDSRIKVIYRLINGHISEASNSALSLATGDYVALLDHDDLISEEIRLIVAVKDMLLTSSVNSIKSFF